VFTFCASADCAAAHAANTASNRWTRMG
jgi:hypothetical protein